MQVARGHDPLPPPPSPQLYEKNAGEYTIDKIGLTRTNSAVSGNLLVSTVNKNRSGVRDPMSGTPLRYVGAQARVTTPMAKQQMLYSRSFYLTKDVDISIQTLRNTTKVSRYTNEKVGTAGSPTGLDQKLTAYKRANNESREG